MSKVNKHELPVKQCAVCSRPFTWRKKWAAVWAEVKYCSQRCRRRRTRLVASDAENFN